MPSKWFFLLFSILFCSCQSIAFLMYGIKKPHPVSIQKIEKKALKLGIDTSSLYSIRSEQYFKVMNGLKSVPNIRVYDSAGNLYNFRENPQECIRTAEVFLQNLRRDSSYNYLNDSSFYRLPLQVEGLHGQKFGPASLPDADFYAFIFWGTFIGKLNKNNVIPWTDLAQQNRHAKIHPIYITCDILEEWGDDWELSQPPALE